MKKVAILTDFKSVDYGYSLTHVVQNQIKMLTRAGYEVLVTVVGDFKPAEAFAHPQVKLFQLPVVQITNNMSAVEDKNFQTDIQTIYEAYKEALKDIDVVLTHDLVYQPGAVKHQIAARRLAAERQDLKWLHWIHSATSPMTITMERRFYEGEYKRLLIEQFPNSYYIFFNDWSKRRIATNFGVPVSRVKTVYHPTDILGWFGMHEFSKQLIEKHNLLSPDLLAVYPVRLDSGKNAEVVLEIMITLRNKGYETKTVIADFHSTSSDPNDPKFQVRQKMKDMAKRWKYEDNLIFTSEFIPETRGVVPPQMIRDLMLISNIFVMASRSESYSLITQEAALTKNLILLNDDFPPFREIFGDHNFFIKVGSNVNVQTQLDGETETQYRPNQDQYMEDKALEIITEFNRNPVLKTNQKIRKERNLDYVWKNQLEPLIESS